MAWVRTASTTIVLSCLFINVATAQNTTCYAPNGDTVDDAFPCGDPTTGHQTCCPTDSYCMEEGLCMTDTIGRGVCTDQTWKDPACPTWCADVYNNNYCSIVLFIDAPERLFCCAPYHNAAEDNTCFDNNGNNGTGFLFPGFNQKPFGITGFANSSYNNLMPWLTIASADNSPSNGSVVLTPSTSSVPQSDHTGRDVGIGVGVALGVLLIIALGFGFWQMRRVAKLQHRLDEKLVGSSVSGPAQTGGWYASPPQSLSTSHANSYGPPEGFAQSKGGYSPAPQHELESVDRFHELSAGR